MKWSVVEELVDVGVVAVGIVVVDWWSWSWTLALWFVVIVVVEAVVVVEYRSCPYVETVVVVIVGRRWS